MDVISIINNQTLVFDPENFQLLRLPTFFVLILSLICIFGFFTNLSSIFYILFNFSLGNSAFLILFLDAFSCLLGLTSVQGALISIWITSMLKGESYPKESCPFLAFGLSIPNLLGPFFLSLLSLTRFFVVKSKEGAALTDKKNGKFVKVLVILAIIYLTIIYTIVRSKGGYFAPIEGHCLSGDYYHSRQNGSPIGMAFVIPCLVGVFLPILLDILTLRHLERSIQPFDQSSDDGTAGTLRGPGSEEEHLHQQAARVLNGGSKNLSQQPKALKKDPLEIPIRATFVSGIMGIIFFFIVLISIGVFSFPYEIKLALGPFVAAIFSSIRVAIIVKLTVRKNEVNAAVSKSEERAKKQAAEIQFALQARERRQNNQPQDPFM